LAEPGSVIAHMLASGGDGDYVRGLAFFLISLFAIMLYGCAGNLDKPERFAAVVKKYTVDAGKASGSGGTGGASAAKSDAGAGKAAPPACVLQVFKMTCGIAGCHAKGTPQVDLASTGVADRLIDRQSASMACKGRVFVSSSGMSSLLLDKLTDSPPCGAKMPLTGTLNAADLKCLTSWVQSLDVSGQDAGGM
jgi:hypothetical protein